MLFGPEQRKQLRHPSVDRAKPVQPRMARRAYRDQTIRMAVAGFAMVYMKHAAVPCPAARASKPVALQHRFPIAAEVILRMAPRAITLSAQPGDGGHPFAAHTEQRLLPELPVYGSPYRAAAAGNKRSRDQTAIIERPSRISRVTPQSDGAIPARDSDHSSTKASFDSRLFVFPNRRPGMLTSLSIEG